LHFKRDLERADFSKEQADWVILKLEDRMKEWRCPDFETGGSFKRWFRYGRAFWEREWW
jgi:hypothetical protein